MKLWEKDDFVDINKISEACRDPKSPLSLLMQDLLVVREMEIDKAKALSKRGASHAEMSNQMGVISGLDLAIKRPEVLIQLAKREMEARREREQVNVA